LIDPEQALRTLVSSGVEFIVVGGVAGVIHGAARATYDVDVVYRRDDANLDRLVAALAPFSPYPRDAPPGLPFRWDARTVRQGLNFTLDTRLGAIDVLGEVAGGVYETLLPHSIEVDLGGFRVRCVDLPTLIRLKRAAGRAKDFEALAELEAILARRAAEPPR
jgi:predicted nucleotidyltransferase